MPPIEWQPMLPGSTYYATLTDVFVKPHDGYELIQHWTGVEVEKNPETGKQKRHYWLQALARGRNDRKAVLTVFGFPMPPTVTQEHIDDALELLGWEKYEWSIKHQGAAWIIKKFE